MTATTHLGFRIVALQSKVSPLKQFIETLLNCIPDARSRFYARGFNLPVLYLSTIESMRVRPSREHDFQYFLDEITREYVCLKYPWQPKVRSQLKPSERSEYLDMLSSYYSDPSVPLSLDPNFDIFVRRYRDDDLNLLNRFRDQKQNEQNLNSSQIIKVLEVSHWNSKDVVETICGIATRLGYQRKTKKNAAPDVLEFLAEDDGKGNIELQVVDLPGIRKHGQVFVQYRLANFPNKPFGLGSFVPGGDEYSESNNSLEAIGFAFYVQCQFLTDLRLALARFSD